MSFALQTSSAVNKSGKVAAPKIANRRRPGAERRNPIVAAAPRLPTPPATQILDERSEGQKSGVTEVTSGGKTSENDAQRDAGNVSTERPLGAVEALTVTHTTQTNGESAPAGHVSDTQAVVGTAAGTGNNRASATGDTVETAGQRLERLLTAENESSAGEVAPDDTSSTPAAGQKRKRDTAPLNGGIVREGKRAKQAVAEPSSIAADSGTSSSSQSQAPSRTSKRKQAAIPAEETAPMATMIGADANPATNPPEPGIRSRPRGRKPRKSAGSGNGTGEGDSPVVTDQSAAGGPARPTESSGTQVATDNNSGRPKPRARQRKLRNQRSIAASEDRPGGPSSQENEQEQTSGHGAQHVDPELLEIDPEKTKMLDLVQMPIGGKVSNLEKRMDEIDWAEVKRKRREEPQVAPSGTAEAREDEAPPVPRNDGTQLRIVNGEIAVDESTQHIDREAEALREAENFTISENADVTKQVNRMTWINDKRRDPADRLTVYQMRTQPWTYEETDRFYEALRMFGTDFNIISKMFPPKTRRQIKLKFVREERLEPDRVNLALSGQQIIPMDLKHFADESGLDQSEFKDPEEVTQELAREEERLKKEVEEKAMEAQEAAKQKELMESQREKEKEGRDRERALRKQQQELKRRRVRGGRNGEAYGTGTMG